MRSLILAVSLAAAGLHPLVADELHVPAKGSAERKAILDALRALQFPQQQVVYVVNFLYVHNDYAWVDVSPQDLKGKAVAEGGAALLHHHKGTWKFVDISKIPGTPEDSDDPSQAFVKNLIKVYPDIPADIFLKRKN